MKLFLAILCLSALASPMFAADSAIDSLLEKARILRQSNRSAEGRPIAEQAANLALKQGAWEQLNDARQELSFDEMLAHNYDRVLQLRLAELDTLRSHREAFTQEDSEETTLQTVCAAYDWKKDYQSAIRYCRESVVASEAHNKAESNPGLGLARPLQALGINLYLAGQYAEAEKVLRDAYAQFAAFSQVATVFSQGASSYEPQVEVLRWLQRVLVAQHHTEQALEIAELGRSRALAASLEKGASAPPPLSLEMARKVAQDHQTTIIEYSLLYDFDPDLLFIFSNFEDKPVTSIYIWVIQPDGRIVFHESKVSPNGPSLVAMVRGAHASLGAHTRAVTVEPEKGPTETHPLEDLYKLLIAPIAADLPHDPSNNVTFVLQDWLFMVPFAALRDDAGRYLIESHAISVSPSLDVLRLTREQSAAGGKGKGVLVVGNPLMPSIALQNGETPRQLNALPGAEQEARTVAAEFQTTALLGTTATKEQVLRRLPNAQIAHFATHGLLDQRNGGFQSAIALAPGDGDDGFLTAGEIQHLKLSADLVVLSACNTALGKMSGDGIFGLSRSFLTAGVPSVMVSLWAISDESTAYLMEHFYRRMQAGQDKAGSLRGAMLDTKEKYPAPLNWAAFVLVGETSFARGSRNTSGDAVMLSADQHLASNFALPVPQNVRELSNEPNQQFGGTVSDISYETDRPLAELLAYYKRELDRRGLKEQMAWEQISPKEFSLVYFGPWLDRQVEVSGSDKDGSRSVRIGFAFRGGGDGQYTAKKFVAAVNQANSGLFIPEDVTGLHVSTKFNLSSGTGDVEFLSQLTPQQLHELYRGVLQQAGFTEYAFHNQERDGIVDCEFRGKLVGRALFFHIEKSSSSPVWYRQVRIYFGSPSK